MDTSGVYDEYSFVAEFYDFVVPYRERQDVGFFVENGSKYPGELIFVARKTSAAGALDCGSLLPL